MLVYWCSRSRVDPLYNTVVVAGTKTNHQCAEPYLGVVNLRGVSYTPKYIATGMGAMLIQVRSA